MNPSVIFFIDGENLVMRYQKMVADGKVPREGVIHKTDTYVWHPSIVRYSAWHVVRVSYYTVIVAAPERRQEVEDEISQIQYNYRLGFGFLNPHVFEKGRANEKTKSVDINMVTDFLRQAHNQAVDELCILTGDGDFLPAVRAAMQTGMKVYGGAFSEGLNLNLRRNLDEFINLDEIFFEPDTPPQTEAVPLEASEPRPNTVELSN